MNDRWNFVWGSIETDEKHTWLRLSARQHAKGLTYSQTYRIETRRLTDDLYRRILDEMVVELARKIEP